MFTVAMFLLTQVPRRVGPYRGYSSVSKGNDKPLNRPYRPCVGAIIFNSDGKLLCGKRIDISYWQFPQGGMHPEEDPLDCAIREIQEEVGLTVSQYRIIKDQHLPIEKFTYHQPLLKDGKQYAGQEQRYVLFRWDGNISECNLHSGLEPAEFSQIDWLSWEELIKLSVPSRTFIYARLRNTVKPMITEYLLKEKEERSRGKKGETPSKSGAMPWGEYLSYNTSPIGSEKLSTELNYFRNSDILPELEMLLGRPLL